jgi:hypothetical protein
MTWKKIVPYGALLAAAVLGSLGVRLWLDSLDVHDYSALREARPAVVLLTDEVLDDALGHSFAFRTVAGPGGEEMLIFNSGMCLQAHRAQRGEAVSWADRVVQQAILIMWKEPWMQEFSEAQIAELKMHYLADVGERDVPSHETMDRMSRDFVAALVQLPDFQSDFPRCIEQAALELEQAIAWEQ